MISNFENNHLSGNFKGQHPFKALCWNVNENCDVYVAIDRAGYQLTEQQEKKGHSSGFLGSLYLTNQITGQDQ